MLVLTRRPGESIVVGHNIVITLIEVKGGQVRIGIDAPRDIDVHRLEIYEQVRSENQAAVADAQNAKLALGSRRAPHVKSPPTE
jgi:carbon storage regulator